MQCDVQDRILNFIENRELFLETIRSINSEAPEIFVTEQNSKVFGHTDSTVWEEIKDKAILQEKISFSMVPEL